MTIDCLGTGHSLWGFLRGEGRICVSCNAAPPVRPLPPRGPSGGSDARPLPPRGPSGGSDARPDLTHGEKPRVDVSYIELGWPLPSWHVSIVHGVLSYGDSSAYTLGGARRKGDRLMRSYLRHKERERLAAARLRAEGWRS